MMNSYAAQSGGYGVPPNAQVVQAGGYSLPANAQVIQVVHPAGQAAATQQYPAAMPGATVVRGQPPARHGQSGDPLAYYKQYASHGGAARGKYRASIKATDIMEEDMVQDCVDVASEALDRFAIEKDMARFVKYELDKKYGPTWHVIVGKSFGSFIAHERGSFIHFFIGDIAFMFFKLR